MRSDDLAPLLGPGPGDPSTIRGGQGVVVEWDPLTAANVIRFRGADLVNLPILATAAEVLLIQPGDSVFLHIVGDGGITTVYIVGRITKPGTPQAAQALRLVSDRIVAASDAAEGSLTANNGFSGGFADLNGASAGPSVTTTVGSSGKALVLFGTELAYFSTTAGGTLGYASVAVSGATAVAASTLWEVVFGEVPSTTAPRFGAAKFHIFTGLNPGEHTFKMLYRAWTSDTVNRSVFFREREIAVFAL